MRSFFFEMSDFIVYATGLCWLVAGVWSGIQVLSTLGEYSQFLILGILLIVLGVAFAALHCLLCFALLDIRSYSRHTAKILDRQRR